MNALVSNLPVRTTVAATFPMYEDPLDEDASSDRAVAATRRGLTRLALVAAETGARFQREGVGHDPMAWLLAPRRLFGGAIAIEAVLDRTDFMRALLLHGLSIGLDADPRTIDGLAGDCLSDDHVDTPGVTGCNCGLGCNCGEGGDEDEGGDASDPDEGADDGWYESAGDTSGGRSATAGRRLFTATLVHDDGRTTLQAFHASVCSDAFEATGRLAQRYGVHAAADAEVSEGFDPSSTFAEVLVSPALGHMLTLVAAEPDSPLAAGLDLNLEQRFAA